MKTYNIVDINPKYRDQVIHYLTKWFPEQPNPTTVNEYQLWFCGASILEDDFFIHQTM